MNPYYIIFINSLKSSILISMYSENAWYAAVQFGGYNLWAITGAAIAGSVMGNCLNFGAGYYLGCKRNDWFVFKEEWYAKLSKLNNYSVYLLGFPISAIPVIGVFWSLFVLVTGFFHANPVKSILLIACGRALYYGYYLYGIQAGAV